MARPSRCRRICCEPGYDSFIPDGIPHGEKVVLTVDEYETIRLIDINKLTQEQCSKQMDISRTTVAEIYDSAREKIADCIVNGKQLHIDGGNYRLCDGDAHCYCGEICHKSGSTVPCQAVQNKGEKEMRIAVTYENGNIFQHFGHTSQFKLYDTENSVVTKEQIVGTMGNGHGALAGFLKMNAVDVLICGGIGGGAQTALADADIKLFGGVSGNADEAVKAYLEGQLDYNPSVYCEHHSGDHSCGSHSCGEDKGGCKGN